MGNSVPKSVTKQINALNSAKNKYEETITHNSKSFKGQRIGQWLRKHSKHINDDVSQARKPVFLSYKQGTFVKVDFGINVGSEISGSHFAIVLTKGDTIHKDQLTVLPLSSKNHDSYLNIDLSMITEIRQSIEATISRLKILIDDYKRVTTEGLVSRNIEDSAVAMKEMLQSKVTLEVVNTIGLSEDIIAHQINNLDNLVFNEMEDFLQINKDKLMREVVMLNDIFSQYATRAMNSYALIDSITTISKKRLLNKQNKYDPIGEIIIKKSSLKKIHKEIRRRYAVKSFVFDFMR